MKKDTVEKLQSGIDAILEQDNPNASPLDKYKKCVTLALSLIKDLKGQLATAGFKDQKEEIWFFKEKAPKVWGIYIYFTRLVEVEVLRKTRSSEKFHEILLAELKEAELFPEKHSICEYYYQGRTDQDEQFFIRHIGSTDGEMGVFLGNDFTIGAYWLAQMRANEALRSWLTEQLEQGPSPSDEIRRVKKLVCYANPVEIVEVFKAFHLKNWFGKASFKDVMRWAREALDVNMGNYDVTLQELQRRKTGQTKCLDDAREKFREWMNKKS